MARTRTRHVRMLVALGMCTVLALAGCGRGSVEQAPSKSASQSSEPSASSTDTTGTGAQTTPRIGGQSEVQPQGAVDQAPTGWGEWQEWLLVSADGVDPKMFVRGVDNPYWPLKTGTKWTYSGGGEDIEVEVLPETKQIAGVTCVVVRDTVTSDGELAEDTRDWYAQDVYGNVWYMGEDTKEYDGKKVSTTGSWEAGVDGARPGIKVWAQPHVDQPAYFQEFQQGVAEDLAKDLNMQGSAKTPLGTYENLLVVEEWTPLEPDVVERKYYAKGVGTVKEQEVKGGSAVNLLTSVTQP